MPVKGRCVICTCDFVSTNVASLKCGHTFHAECISKWIETSKTCPSCRKKNAKSDVIRLYFDDSEPSASQQADAEHRVEELAIALSNEKDDNRKAQAKAAELEMKLKLTEQSLKREREATSKMRLKDEKITQLELMLQGKHETEQKMKVAQDRLKACEFYTLLKGRGSSNVEDVIDSYIGERGDVDTAKFLKMTRRQLKDVEQKLNETVKELTKLQAERADQDRKLTKYKKLTADLQEELATLKKTDSTISPLNARLKNVINYSPELEIHKRLSLGFSFNNDSGYAHELLESAFKTKYPTAPKRRAIIDDDDTSAEGLFGKPLNFDDSFKAPAVQPSEPKDLKAFSFEESPKKENQRPSVSGVGIPPHRPQRTTSPNLFDDDDDADISIPGSVLRRVNTAAAVPKRFASSAENAYASVENNVVAVSEARQVLQKQQRPTSTTSLASTVTDRGVKKSSDAEKSKSAAEKATKRPLERSTAQKAPAAKKPNTRISTFFRRVHNEVFDADFASVEIVQLD